MTPADDLRFPDDAWTRQLIRQSLAEDHTPSSGVVPSKTARISRSTSFKLASISSVS